MFDALLYCSIIVANMRHAGYFAVAASFLQAAKAKWDALRAAAVPKLRTAAPTACAAELWMQSLARLETYVAARA